MLFSFVCFVFFLTAVYMLNSVLFCVCVEECLVVVIPFVISTVYILLAGKRNSGKSHEGWSAISETLGLFCVTFDRKLLDTAQHRD